MPIRRWDPLRDLLTLQERMNRLFEHSLVRGHLADPAMASAGWTPLADVLETAEGFVLQIEVPGIAEEDIEVHVDGDTVVVRGQRQPVRGSRPTASTAWSAPTARSRGRSSLTKTLTPIA